MKTTKAEFGIYSFISESAIQPVELAQWLEKNGFESFFFGEHSHIPVSRKTAVPSGRELPEVYRHYYDPLVLLSVMAGVTTKLLLGTAVLLLPEHHAIQLAKRIGCLDHISNGRVVLGVGAGWNVEELADFGVEFKDRWKITRETVYAMRQIWANDEAEYHGDFINFDPLWCWPKPVQPGGPPILMGAYSRKWTAQRVVEYCNGWIPMDGTMDLAEGIREIRGECAKINRPFEEIQLTVMTAYSERSPELRGEEGKSRLIQRVADLIDMGFTRVIFMLDNNPPAQQYLDLERYREIMNRFR